MTVDALLNLASTALLALFGGVLWAIWQEIKTLRSFKHGANNNLHWLNWEVENLTGRGYDGAREHRH